MAIADTASAKMAWGAESTWGDGGASFSFLRFTSDDLRYDTPTTNSEEVTGDREPRGAVRTAASVTGSVSIEMTGDTFDTWMEHALMSTWSSLIGKSSQSINITNADATNGTADLVDAAAASAFSAVVAGQWLKLDGFTDSTNNTYVFVTAKTDANNISISGAAFTDESGQTDISVEGSYLRIGTTKKSMAIERQWTDINVFDLFSGLRVSEWGLTLQPGSIVNGTFGFLGKDQATNGSTQAGSPTAVNNNEILNAVDHAEGFYLGATGTTTRFGKPSSLCLSQLDWTMNNNLRAQQCVGQLAPAGIGVGIVNLTGNLSTYLEDSTELSNFIAGTRSSWAIRLNDGAGHVYMVTAMEVLWTNVQDSIQGASADGFFNAQYTCETDSSGVAFQIDRFQTP